jgi:hypothetical protein
MNMRLMRKQPLPQGMMFRMRAAAHHPRMQRFTV